MVRTLIIGTGDMALGLCRQFSIHAPNDATDEEKGGPSQASVNQQHHLEVTGVHIQGDQGLFQETGVPYVDLYQGLDNADIVILAIPSKALQDFVFKNIDSIKSKIVVDISNPGKKGQNLVNALGELYKSHGIDYNVHWVKAFNDVGALDLITRSATSKKGFSTLMCGNDAEATNKVKAFAEEALAFDVKILPRSSFAAEMEESQASIGWEWIHTFWIMLIIHFAAYLYIAIRVHKGFGTPRANMPTYTMSRAFGSTALTGFAFTQIPGIYANLLRTFGGRGAKFPRVLLWSLAIRKHMGLASFWALCAHAILTCLIFSPVYHSRFFDPVTNRLLLYPELSFLFATLGFCLYAVCAIASLPAVGAAMNYRQWDFVFGKLIWLALVFGTLHPVMLGVKGWKEQSSRPLGMPSPTLMSSLIPFTVFAAKFFQVLVCWMQRWWRQRARYAQRHPSYRRESVFQSMHGFTKDQSMVVTEHSNGGNSKSAGSFEGRSEL